MEIFRTPPVDGQNVRTGTSLTGQGAPAAGMAPVPDRADIRPLDISSALQILLAEVRGGFDLPVDAAVQTPAEAARLLVQLFLQELPENPSDAPAWALALSRTDAVIQTSMERAIGIVTQWRNVPAATVDAVKETRALFVAALDDDPRTPLWLQPEWMRLAPLILRFRRRRRNARRRLVDPDYSSGSLDEGEETGP